MHALFQLEEVIIELLLVISLVAIMVQRLRLPYTVALVMVGLALSVADLGEIEEVIVLTPDLILALFVPPLIFEAAFHLDADELRRNITPILTMAVPGVIVTMGVVGGLIVMTTPLSMEVALVFGALIAATDPVAIIALFRTLGVPKQLSTLVEGESLLNDGTAIVVFNLSLGVALTGHFDLAEGILDFIQVVAGGLAIGVAMGSGIAWLIARVDDHLIEITLTTVLAFGSFLLAEELHFSGVLAVVAAGLLNGNMASAGMSPTTKIILNNFWEYIAFLANSFIFLMIGLEVPLSSLSENVEPILWAIVGVLIARFWVVYGLGTIANRLAEPVPMPYRHILAWGGLRGAISLALVLTISTDLAEAPTLRAMTFGVVLFTLFVQGPTVSPLLRWLGIIKVSHAQVEYEVAHARLTTLQAAYHHLEDMRGHGTISSHTWDSLNPTLKEQISELTSKVRDLLHEQPELAADDLEVAEIEMLRAQRSSLLELRRNNIISAEAFETIAVEIDQSLGILELPGHVED